jgi:flagellar basal-body rod protein FlgG
MLKGIYDAASGMLPQVIRQDATAHNLANVNTAGFKRELVIAQEFSKAGQEAATVQADWEIPQIAEIAIDFSPGAIEETGSRLHLALDGDAFFTVSTPSGEMYTRAGNFGLSSEGKLVTADGYPVLAENGEISLAGKEFAVDERGRISVNGVSTGILKLVTFPAPYPLERTSPGLFGKIADAPNPTKAVDFTVRQGALERSNINIISEMVNMIESYRHFETAQRMVQIQDQSLDKAINQLGTVGR